MTASAVREYDCPWTWQEFTVATRKPNPWAGHVLLLVRDALGETVAAADVELPLQDNTTQAWVSLWVRPEHLGGDGGDELAEHVKTLARENGRKVVLAEAPWDLDGSRSGLCSLLERHGFALALPDGHRVLELPADGERLRQVAADAAAHHTAYRLVSWSGACPDEYLEAFAGLRARLASEAPRGELEIEDEEFGPARARHEEDELAAQQRTVHTTVAVHVGGTLAGHSQLVVPGTDVVNAHQWDTLVVPEHRGHRLGLALKARNLLEAGPALGSRTRLHTWNAVENTPMIDINEQIGFRLVEYVGEFQCRL
ncbi:MAG: GNAT family N-acetyltransferase, partial [Nocardioidaceae bacterium]